MGEALEQQEGAELPAGASFERDVLRVLVDAVDPSHKTITVLANVKGREVRVDACKAARACVCTRKHPFDPHANPTAPDPNQPNSGLRRRSGWIMTGLLRASRITFARAWWSPLCPRYAACGQRLKCSRPKGSWMS